MKKEIKVVSIVSLLTTLAACGSAPSDINVNGSLNTAKSTQPDPVPAATSTPSSSSADAAPSTAKPQVQEIDGTFLATTHQCGAVTNKISRPLKMVISNGIEEDYNMVNLCNDNYLRTLKQRISYDATTLTLKRETVYSYADKSGCTTGGIGYDAFGVASSYYFPAVDYGYTYDGVTLTLQTGVCDGKGNKGTTYFVKQ